MNVKRIGLDLAKNVFEFYGVNEREQRVLSKTVRRGRLLATFAQMPPSVVGMEVCGSAHY
jgi:transposase